MKVFYYCFDGARTSVIAAGIHLGLLPSDRFPDSKELGRLSFFDSVPKSELGKPRFMGTDSFGNEIFTFGVTYDKEVIKNSVNDLLNILNLDEEILLIDTTHINNWLVKLGLRLPGRVGLFFYSQGLEKDFMKLVSIVRYHVRL